VWSDINTHNEFFESLFDNTQFNIKVFPIYKGVRTMESMVDYISEFAHNFEQDKKHYITKVHDLITDWISARESTWYDNEGPTEVVDEMIHYIDTMSDDLMYDELVTEIKHVLDQHTHRDRESVGQTTLDL
jgi:hypothetical protein